MVQGYTTIEQSCKLIELGLDPRTADMFYATEFGTLIAEPPYEVEGYEPCVPFTPAWSLAALLELMPACINDDNDFLVIEKDETYLNEPIWRVSYKHYIKEDTIVERNAPLINAAFETVCWLIEQGHIKVNK